MASQLRVDEIIASTGSSVAIGTAGGSVTLSGDFTVDTSKGLNVGTGATIFSPSSNVLTLGTNSAERVRITSSGLVGIGTDNPARLLQVYNASSNPQVNIKAASGGTCELQFGDNADDVRGNIVYNCTDDYLSLHGYNNAERLRITSSGNIGIGLTNPTYSGVFGGSQRVLHISGTAAPSLRIQSSTANQGDLSIQAGNSGADVQISNMATNGDIVFYTHPSGSINEAARFTDSGNLKFPSGQGIDFSADGNAAGMTSELLDDYEEGTWTPTLTGTSGGSYTAGGSNFGWYRKIGTLVTVGGTVHWTAQTTAYSGLLIVSGLPYASNINRSGGSIGAGNGLTFSSGYSSWTSIIDIGSSSFYIIQVSSSNNTYSHNPTVGTSGIMYGFMVTYATT